MTFFSGDTDYASWYAALAIVSSEGEVWDSLRMISYASERVAVFDEVAEFLTSCYEDIFLPYHADYLGESDIAAVFDEYFPERTRPDEGWSHWDLIPLLKELELEARQEIGEFETNICDTRWHGLIEMMSESLNPKSHGLVLMEGLVPDLPGQLLDYLSRDICGGPFTGNIAWDTRLIGKLHILAHLHPRQWYRVPTMELFANVVERFNKIYGV